MELSSVSGLESCPLMGGDSEKISGRGERKQETRVSLGG
jgi:hypothetical protein